MQARFLNKRLRANCFLSLEILIRRVCFGPYRIPRTNRASSIRFLGYRRTWRTCRLDVHSHPVASVLKRSVNESFHRSYSSTQTIVPSVILLGRSIRNPGASRWIAEFTEHRTNYLQPGQTADPVQRR